MSLWSCSVANPKWEGRLCGDCLTGWVEWAAEDPDGIRVVSVNAIITGD